jgi:hypothetical protein
LEFQRTPHDLSTFSYIWEVGEWWTFTLVWVEGNKGVHYFLEFQTSSLETYYKWTLSVSFSTTHINIIDENWPIFNSIHI